MGAGSELAATLLLEQFQHARVENLRNFFLGRVGILLHQEIFIVRQSGSVVEQVANCDGFSVGREFGGDVGEMVIVVELAIVDEEHDACRRELFGKRCQPKVRLRVDRAQGAKVGDTISATENGLAVADDEDCGAGSCGGF